MKRQHVESSVIRSVGYEPQTAVLEIRFTSGDVHRYFAVPARVHRGLMEAESPGRFFGDHIRNVYPTEQVL